MSGLPLWDTVSVNLHVAQYECYTPKKNMSYYVTFVTSTCTFPQQPLSSVTKVAIVKSSKHKKNSLMKIRPHNSQT